MGPVHFLMLTVCFCLGGWVAWLIGRSIAHRLDGLDVAMAIPAPELPLTYVVKDDEEVGWVVAFETQRRRTVLLGECKPHVRGIQLTIRSP